MGFWFGGHNRVPGWWFVDRRDTEFEFALLGAEDDRLAVHAADHVEGRLGFAAQGQLQEVFLDAGLEGLAQLGLDLEEAVRRAQAVDALVRALVVVIFDPEFDALAGVLEAVELGADQELLPDAWTRSARSCPGSWGDAGGILMWATRSFLSSASKRLVPRQEVYWRPLSVSISLGGLNSPTATR